MNAATQTEPTPRSSDVLLRKALASEAPVHPMVMAMAEEIV